jgi:hypothetical protein
VADGQIESIAESLLGEPGARYVHVRDTVAGCYDLRIERG